jgi:hypothetical protein
MLLIILRVILAWRRDHGTPMAHLANVMEKRTVDKIIVITS